MRQPLPLSDPGSGPFRDSFPVPEAFPRRRHKACTFTDRSSTLEISIWAWLSAVTHIASALRKPRQAIGSGDQAGPADPRQLLPHISKTHPWLSSACQCLLQRYARPTCRDQGPSTWRSTGSLNPKVHTAVDQAPHLHWSSHLTKDYILPGGHPLEAAFFRSSGWRLSMGLHLWQAVHL